MANWLSIELLSNWEFSVIQGFQYDHVTDDQIHAALNDIVSLQQIDPSLDWEDDAWLSDCVSIAEENKHAYRVAALVHALRNGRPLKNSVELDTFNSGRCCSCISNGHHRIRALQYLGVPVVPADLSGHLRELKKLVAVASASCLPEHVKYFCTELLSPDKHAVRAAKTKSPSP